MLQKKVIFLVFFCKAMFGKNPFKKITKTIKINVGVFAKYTLKQKKPLEKKSFHPLHLSKKNKKLKV
jgi:hypothetical protein